MLKNKIFLIIIIALLLSNVFMYYFVKNIINERDVYEAEKLNFQSYIQILQNRINELMDEIDFYEHQFEYLLSENIITDLARETIYEIIRISRFVPDFVPIRDSYAVSQKFSPTHQAIDFSVPIGTSVHAAASGIVITKYFDRYFGNVIMIDHLNSYKTFYAHLDTFLTEINAFVEKGQVIGKSGNTGNSTDPHLHFQIFFESEPINPTNLMTIKPFHN